MSEDHPPLVKPVGEDQPVVATLEWEGDSVVWVNVQADWLDQVGTAGLLGQVRRAYQKAQPGAGDWRLEVSLADVSLTDLREFTALVREATAAEPTSRSQEPIVVQTRHLESHWSPRGQLLRIRDPRHWLINAPRQTLAEELTEVLQRPTPDITDTRAARRLKAFTGRKDS